MPVALTVVTPLGSGVLSPGPEQAEIQPDGDQDDDARDDRRQEGRKMGEDQAVADDGDGQRPQHGADHRAAAAEQAGAAEHHGGDDVEFEAAAGIGRAAAQPGGDDDAGERGGAAAQHVDGERHPADVDAGAAHRLGIGADAGDVAAEGGLVEDQVADRQHDHRDDRRHRHAEHPAAADLVEQAVGVDRDRIAPGQQQRGAADGAQARQGDDEGGNALIGDEEALDQDDQDTEQQHEDD